MITVLLYYSAMVDHWIGTQTSGLLMAVSRLYPTYHPLFLCIIHNAPLSQLDALCIVYRTRIATICTTRSQGLFLTLKLSPWLCHVSRVRNSISPIPLIYMFICTMLRSFAFYKFD